VRFALASKAKALTDTNSSNGPLKRAFGSLLLLIVIASFNAGMFATLGLRHASPGREFLHSMFLLGSCVSLITALAIANVLFKRISSGVLTEN
jgi:hypothetical protein